MLELYCAFFAALVTPIKRCMPHVHEVRMYTLATYVRRFWWKTKAFVRFEVCDLILVNV